MAHFDTYQPVKTFRGTLEEVLKHRDEIPDEVQVELRILPQEAKPVLDEKTTAAIAFLDMRIAEGVSADPNSKQQAEEELEEFKRNMNANREATSGRLIFL